MAEEAPEIDPGAEARRIVNKYLSELGWAKEYKNMVVRQLIPAIEKDVKLRQGDEMELAADEHFGTEVDRWRKEVSKPSKAVLSKILELLKNRSDLSYFAKRMVNRLKEGLP
jgi:ABC-type uncharacterized transport system auxiliary subunit